MMNFNMADPLFSREMRSHQRGLEKTVAYSTLFNDKTLTFDQTRS